MSVRHTSLLDIWIIQIAEPLPIRGDERRMRSNILAEELAHRGHNVVLWVSAFDHNSKKWAIRSESQLIRRENIRVVVLKGTGYKRNISLARFLDHRVISWKFKGLAKKKEKPDVIIASLPPHDLAFQSVKYAKRNGIPAIVDVRDTWPDIFLDNIPEWLRGIGRILLFREFQMVKNTMKEADCLFAVSNSFLEWGLHHGKRNRSIRDQVFYLGYHRPDANVKMENVGTELKEALDALGDRTVVTYIGTFSEFQDPSVISECSRRLEMSDTIFVLAGYGSLCQKAKEEAKSQRNVFFPGWLNGDEIDALLLKSKIGICPYSKKSEIFPNKAFMYLSAGIPVISSYQGDLKSIIESERIGYYFNPGDVDALTDAILTLSGNLRIREEMSRNANRVFELRFSEEKIYQGYADFVERMASESRA